jgi:hypothetical protein
MHEGWGGGDREGEGVHVGGGECNVHAARNPTWVLLVMRWSVRRLCLCDDVAFSVTRQ